MGTRRKPTDTNNKHTTPTDHTHKQTHTPKVEREEKERKTTKKNKKETPGGPTRRKTPHPRSLHCLRNARGRQIPPRSKINPSVR